MNAYDYYIQKLEDWRAGKCLYEEVEEAREIYEMGEQ